ncbi:LamG-like jellyroll fold domain-containing protein [Streptomyces sp. NPDC002164]|uniref:protein kinase domain-containing protein n=1 Tax=Streptomyces sp. NPDC002164 TaxID=3364633 RepID=UPI0036CE2CBC
MVQPLKQGDPSSLGDYRVVGRLGEGGMGRVFLGRSPSGRSVAIKMVHASLVHEPEFRARFRSEVQASRAVGGAFTAPVIDADTEAEQPWMVSSYIAGPSLHQAIVDQGALPPVAVAALAAGLAEALVSIHRAGLVHRDLKPSNVLLADDGPRVIDFGIARAFDATGLTRTGVTIGSAGFMSPEQVNGGEITAASDVFSLGAVLTFTAIGVGPFGVGSAPVMLYRVVHEAPDLQAVPDPALRALLADCLAKEPALRPTAQQILRRVASAAAWAGHIPAADHSAAGGQAGVPTRRATLAEMFTQCSGMRLSSSVASGGQSPAPGDPRRSVCRDATAPGAAGIAEAVVPAASQVPGSSVGAYEKVAAPVAPSPTSGARSAPGPAPVPAGSVPGYEFEPAFRSVPGAGSEPVPAGPRPVGAWRLDERSGVRAMDVTGRHHATATAVRWGTGHDEGAEFNGFSSEVATDSAVIDTARGSFTVSAWVRLGVIPPHFVTAVSQDGEETSGFYLQYSSDEGRWAFARPDLRVASRTEPVAGEWTHLTGVCDSFAGELRLFVNGVQEGSVRDRILIVSEGPFVIGRARYGRRPVDHFPGGIKDVMVFDRALTEAEISGLLRP